LGIVSSPGSVAGEALRVGIWTLVADTPAPAAPTKIATRIDNMIDLRRLHRVTGQLGEPNGVTHAGRSASPLATITRKRPHALLVRPSAANLVRRQLITDFAVTQGLPALYGATDFVDAGGLMAYGQNLAELYRRAATYVDRILKGTKRDLPVEQATTFELVINLRAAKALGLTIPPSLLARADQVIDP
jgi:hypothetical protein